MPDALHRARYLPVLVRRARGRAMSRSGGRAVVLWTGGKDSALALFEARQGGVLVEGLVTFVPPSGEFKAHPRPLMGAQAGSLGLPHRTIEIAPPYVDAYESALRGLRSEGVDRLVSGDIAEVRGHEGWLEERAARAGLELDRPLWGRDRRALLDRMLEVGLRPVITALRDPDLPDAWLGMRLDRSGVEAIADLATRRSFDLCGERGEYHTMTLGGPGFQQELSLGKWTLAREGELRYTKVEA